MENKYIKTYLSDILDAICDVEYCFKDFPNRFDLFEKNIPLICVVERKVEIMAEAINRIRKINPSLEIPDARAIIDTRNRIIHAYDSVQPEFLWSLVQRHIPILKSDILAIMSSLDDYGMTHKL